MSDYHKRSIIKAISWRVIATLITMILVFLFTGQLDITLGVGALDITSKLFFYYLHERAWNLIRWGRK